MSIFSYVFTFFLLMDSIGNIPIYISLLNQYPPKRQLYIILREMIIALVVIILFFFLGDLLLDLLDIKKDAVQMAGGVILFLIAIKMIFPQTKEVNKEEIGEEPFIVPLAIPLIAGPSILATVIVYSHQANSSSLILISLLIAWLLSLIVLLASPFLQRLLGKRGIKACEKLMGLILTLISVEMLLKGISLFIARQ